MLRYQRSGRVARVSSLPIARTNSVRVAGDIFWRPWVLLLAATLFQTSLQAGEPRDLFGLPDGALTNGGALVIAGGGSLPEEVYDTFVELPLRLMLCVRR